MCGHGECLFGPGHLAEYLPTLSSLHTYTLECTYMHARTTKDEQAVLPSLLIHHGQSLLSIFSYVVLN